VPDARRPDLPPSLAAFARATDRFRRPLAVTLAAVIAASSPAAALAEGDPASDINDGGAQQGALAPQTSGSSGGSVDPATSPGAITPIPQPAPAATPAPAPAPTPPPAPAPPPPPPPAPPPPPVQAAAPAPPPEPTVVASTPQRDTGVKPHPAPAPVGVAPQAPVPAPAPVVAPQPREVVAVAESHATGSVTVRQGDSLWSIAQDRLGSDASPQTVLTEVDRLWSLNGLQDPDVILAGQHLQT
jgi:LysM repeat protein